MHTENFLTVSQKTPIWETTLVGTTWWTDLMRLDDVTDCQRQLRNKVQGRLTHGSNDGS